MEYVSIWIINHTFSKKIVLLRSLQWIIFYARILCKYSQNCIQLPLLLRLYEMQRIFLRVSTKIGIRRALKKDVNMLMDFFPEIFLCMRGSLFYCFLALGIQGTFGIVVLCSLWCRLMYWPSTGKAKSLSPVLLLVY